MSQENVETVRAALEHLNEGDINGLILLCDSDFELDMSARVFNPKTYGGHEGIRGFYREVKSKKKKATFKFTSSEPGSSFECKVDSGPFQACTSPFSVKVKKGKHTFKVRAKDAAGNTDQTPATQSWKVKKKKK